MENASGIQLRSVEKQMLWAAEAYTASRHSEQWMKGGGKASGRVLAGGKTSN